MRLAILTVSDAGARGLRADASGDAIAAWAAAHGHTLAARRLVADESVAIVQALVAWCDGDEADVVFTTGGTGLSPRDVTPEATRAVLEREAPGLAERMRGVEIERFPRAALSRAIAGTRARTLIVNLPGSTSGVRDGLAALEPVLEHAVAVIRDHSTDHSPGAAGRAAP
ncbi:MAG: MogA/MoaB family molybdenum cofactor biosynthesis protein [Gemmatimonadaceae bacterium]|nr:MogA/MoaB family molybdenum cofactor biosynthesis protein [Gemmatimonadaceae bacterium]